MTDIKEKTEEIVEAVANEADLLTHPHDETKNEAKARQPWMPVIGAILAALILFIAVAFFMN